MHAKLTLQVFSKTAMPAANPGAKATEVKPAADAAPTADAEIVG